MVMSKPPAYQMYAADFDVDTRHMTAEQVGAYIRLLNNAWLNDGIPPESTAQAAIAGVSSAKWKRSIWPALAGCWQENGNGRLVNKRQEQERAKQHEWREKSARGGRKGGRAKSKAGGGQT